MTSSLAPDQSKGLARLGELAGSLAGSGRGAVVFVRGQNGSGKSYLLRRATKSLTEKVPTARVIAGGVSDGRYIPDNYPEEEAKNLSTIGTVFSSVGGLPIPILSPAAKILAQAVELSTAAQELLSEMTSGREPTEFAALFEPLLTAVAREDPAGLLVCLVDDGDWLPGEWWLHLQFSLAAAISRSIPLLLIVAIDPADGNFSDTPVYSAEAVAESLVARSLAEFLTLEPISATDLGSWLGPMSTRLAVKVVEATGGHAGSCAELMRDLKDQGAIEEGPNGWRLGREEQEVGIAYAANRLTQRLIAIFDPDPGEVDQIRQLLRCAALEGNTFTADAVAAAVDRDRDEAIDLFDELCEGDHASALLRDLGGVQVEDTVQGEVRNLWRYGFLRSIDWRVARDRFGGHDGAAAGELADQLKRSYGSDRRVVAHIIAALLKRAGRDEEARDFARLAWLHVSAAVLDSLCALTASADTRNWTPYDYRFAAEVLIRGCIERERGWTLTQGTEYARRAHEFAEKAGPLGGTAVAYALVYRGKFEGFAGNRQRAQEFLKEAIDRSRVGSQTVSGSAHLQLAKILMDIVDPDLANVRTHLETAIAAFREVHSAIGEAHCLAELGELERIEKNFTAALQHNERALQILSDEDRIADVGTVLQFRAEIDLTRGRPDLAKHLLVSLLKVRRDNREQADEAACLRLLSLAERRLGHIDGAIRLMATAVEVEHRLGREGIEAFALVEQGKLEMEAGKPAKAAECFVEAMSIYARLGQHAGVEKCRGLLAQRLD
jgi:tetratricopeptide (TPR) repeat protein